MARYVKSACDTFVAEIQTSIDNAKKIINEKFESLEFHDAQEQKLFESYYSDLISELDDYRTKVGKYYFLLS